MPSLLKINEPASAQNILNVVGIDLGTTHSLVAAVVDGKPRVLKDTNDSDLLPSVVHYSSTDDPVVGVAPLESSEQSAISSVKRLMGRDAKSARTMDLVDSRWTEHHGMPSFKTAQGEVSATQVSAEILKALKKRACKTLGADIGGAVITVPAYFDHAQRSATADAAHLAGIRVLRLLNEPTAAAISYGLDNAQQGVVAVYDLGGGTFDLSILRLEKGVFNVLATAGDSALGGDDFDITLARHILKLSGTDEAELKLDSNLWQELLHYARSVREQLSEHKSVDLSWRTCHAVLKRSEFDALITEYVQRTITVCKQCLTDAGLSLADVDEVVLAGGATRTPAIREAVSQYFAKTPRLDIDPDRVVALGAAIQAHMLANPSEDSVLLLDVVALSLGIEVMGGLMEPVIRRNTPIPASMTREFTTGREGQTAIAVSVYQGERDLVADCRFLGKFELRGIPPMAAGATRIKVDFTVDADGILNVQAEESTTGATSGVRLEPGSGLEENDISSMLEEAFSHSEQDKKARELHERRIEARQLLDHLDSALKADGNQLLSVTERKRIQSAMAKTERALCGAHAAAIRESVASLDKSSVFFAERRMDTAIKKALVGKSARE